MAVTFGHPETAEPITVEYFTWEAAVGGFLVHMHRDAVDGLARDVMEASAGLPVEVGGLLLGHAGRGARPVVWIERYQRLDCGHRSGPDFTPGREEYGELERAASEVSGDLNVVGFYRSHLRPGFQLESSDFEIADRYFKDAEDLILLIRPLEKPESPAGLLAQFFIHERGGGQLKPADPPFPFRGRLVAGSAASTQAPAPEPTSETPEDPKERTGRSVAPLPASKPVRRLVPDFLPSGPAPRPAREFFMEERPPVSLSPTEDLNPSKGFLRRQWPLLAAVLLVGGGAAVFLQQTAHHNAPAASPVADTSPILPLGLYVDPTGSAWRLSWRPSATQGARAVQLFVRDGEEQSRVDLTPKDLEAGVYRYSPKGPDVTFRLEVTDAGGRVSAESFRLVKSQEKPPAPQPPAAAPATHLKPVNEVPPVVPASIRPRIRGTVLVEVKVRVDEHGRVVSATPVSKPRAGVESFLTDRAVAAARQWRYEPGAPGVEIIHFTFKK
jgi:hypothetical protein